MSRSYASRRYLLAPRVAAHLYAERETIVGLHLSRAEGRRGGWWQLFAPVPEPGLEEAIALWMESYSTRQQEPIRLPLRLDHLTLFTRGVLELLRQLPFGALTSYGAVGAQLSNANLARAVGRACGANPLPLLIPCHRVLAARGSLGGYSGGLEIKAELLAFEADPLP